MGNPGFVVTRYNDVYGVETPPPPPQGIEFSDDFESGDLSGVVGGTWYGFTSSNGLSPFVSAANPYEGTYALRFTQNGVPSGTDTSSEARFRTNNTLSELWWEWKQYIPSNYDHRADSPSNNKFWIVGYQIGGTDRLHGGWSEPGGWTVRMELVAASSPNISASRIVYGNETSGFSSEDAAGTGPTMAQAQDVITESDLGKWVTFGVHLKLGTTIAASDAELYFYKNGSLLVSNVGFPIAGTSTTNPADSYELIGWANSGYDNQTLIDIDQVVVYGLDPEWVTTEPLFHDNFSSGDLSHVENGAAWSDSATSSGGIIQVASNQLEITYTGNTDPADDTWAEQNFSFGRLVDEFWVEYDFLVPANYFHRDSGSSNNNKFFRAYHTGTGSGIFSLTVELERSGSSGDSGFRRFLSESGGFNGWPVDTSGVGNIISSTGPLKPGVWSKVRISYRSSSSVALTDGRAQIDIDGVEVHSLDFDFRKQSDGGLGEVNYLYFMGWSNSGFDATTTFKIDNVRIYDEYPGWGVTPRTQAPLFYDKFLTGDRSYTDNNVSWSGSTGVAVTTTNPFPKRTHSLEFTFAGTSPGGDANAEQDFSLGGNYSELWLEFYLYVPNGTEGFGSAAYAHRSDSPSNNKLLRVWGTNYDADNKWGASFTYNGGAGKVSTIIGEYCENGAPIGPTGITSYGDGILGADLGKWVQFRFYAKAASSATSTDGRFLMWKNGNLVIDEVLLDGPFDQGDGYGSTWNMGYLLGWANSGFTLTTKLWIAEVKFFNSEPGWGPLTYSGPGINEPVGMTPYFELDTTRPSQNPHLTTIGAVGSQSTPGGTWVTPDGNGTGAYWNQIVNGVRCQEFRWGIGATDDGRAAYSEVSGGSGLTEIYIRVVMLVSYPHDPWPSGTIKLVDWDNGNNVINISGNPNNNTGFAWLIGNISTSPPGVEFKTNSSGHEPKPTEEFVEWEAKVKYNTVATYDGEFSLYIRGQLVSNWIITGDPTVYPQPFNIRYHSADPQLTLWKLGPYRGGGSGGAPIATESSIWFAHMYVSVK